jgi:hypothetical protein
MRAGEQENPIPICRAVIMVSIHDLVFTFAFPVT